MRIQWDEIDERYIDRGVDHGVVYGPDGSFAPWNGLISVDDVKDSDSIDKYYYEGRLTYAKPKRQAYSGKITAYTYPTLVDKLTGYYEDDDGFVAKRADNLFFNMSYRTGVYNSGEEYYKLHLFYNIVIVDNTVTHSTMTNGSGETTEFVWNITGVPIDIGDVAKGVNHIILDSRKIDPVDIKYIETALYGTTSQQPRMLTTHELLGIRLRSEWNNR